MLVLTRRRTQEVCIGDDIVITITRVKKHVVCLGIEAPREVQILRSELIGRPLDVSARVETAKRIAKASLSRAQSKRPIRRKSAG
jgi:carbon storage regulator